MDLGIFQHEFMQRAVLAGLAVAVVAGLLGVFLVLRQMSMLGDGLAHVSFAGIAVGIASGLYPLGVALALAVAGAVAIQFLRQRQILKGDAAIGILFTAGLAIGIVVVSASGSSVNTTSYLFGNILAIGDQDLGVILAVGAALVLLLVAFYKEFFSMAFSEEAAQVSGLPVHLLNAVFMALTAAAIVAATRVVGVLLVSSLLVVPAAASLQVAPGFRAALALSVAIGVASVAAGILAAVEFGWAVGGSIALAATAFFILAAAGRRLLLRSPGAGP